MSSSPKVVYRPLLLMTAGAEMGTLVNVELTPIYWWTQVAYVEAHP